MQDQPARALVGACLYVAIADREVDPDEMDVLARKLTRLHPEIPAGAAHRLFGQAVSALSNEGRDRFLRRLATGLDDGAVRDALRAAIATAAADGELGPVEAERLVEIAHVFGVSQEELSQLRLDFAERTHRNPQDLRPREPSR